MKQLYALLAVLGTLIPLAVFLPWLLEHGLDIPALLAEAASTTIGLFAWLDVIVSALVLIGFILYEGKKIGMERLWLPILGTCCIGVSLGLPLFLYLREIHLEKTA